jgi:hypothetical protein
MLRGLGEGGDRAGRDGDLAQCEPSPFQISAEGKYAAAAIEELAINAGGTQRTDDLGVCEGT